MIVNRFYNTDVNTVVRIVTDELLQQSKSPTRSIYRMVARELCDKFPQLYDRDFDTKELIGTGYYTIFKKIEERVHYLQRPNKMLKRPVCDGVLGSTKKSRTIKNLSAGCKEWPPSDPDNENLETLQSKKDWLKSNSRIERKQKWNHTCKIPMHSRENFSTQHLQ